MTNDQFPQEDDEFEGENPAFLQGAQRLFSDVHDLGDGRSVGGDSGPQVGALLGHGSGDGAAFHLAFIVDDDAGVVLEVQSNAVFAVIWLSLTDHHRGDNLEIQ